MKRVVMFSGGLGSWAAAKRVAQKHGIKDMVLLFADTMMEDEDLYRFIEEAAANVGVPLTRIADGRTPWQIFFDERFLGDSHHDPCSKILKRQLMDRWVRNNCEPTNTILYVGVDWSEEHRYLRLAAIRAAEGWTVEAPLCEWPYLSKKDVNDLLNKDGIKRPRLYDLGFAHNNCGGFCIKAGQGHFANLLKQLPERYAKHEQLEQDIREMLGKDVSILTDRRGGEKKKMTLKDFRIRIENGDFVDRYEIGGCGCAID